MGNQYYVGIYESGQMKTILTSPKTTAKASIYDFLRPWLGNSLVLAPVPMWRVHRKIIQPAFNPQTLRKFVHIFDKHSKSIVKRMEEELDGGEFEVRSYLGSYALSVALEASMGLTETFDPKISADYGECADRAFKLITKRGFTPLLHPDKIFNLTKMAKDVYRCIEVMHSISHSIIAKKKNELEKHDELKNDEIENKRKGFLDILLNLQDKQKLSDQQICDEVNFMVVAAYDTVSASLQYVLLMLASYPDVQEKVYQELKHIYGEVIPENILFASDDLKEMRYTERVIQESLRLFPPIGFLLRKVEEDLEVGGYILPKGCTTYLAIAKVHRDEKYWPDPLKFDPDRFLPEEVAKRDAYCFLPFSGGPRNCLGHLYGMMEMKTLVARILLEYVLKKKHVQPIENIRQRMEVVSHPIEPIKIEIVRRLPKT
ncbi:cytochrome P450 4C1-like isoform X2 [Belonocnema kinseyi]|nr:cytochrome P450 4C1-like isoform X2 [Belonocnema kinseyi]